MALPCLGRLRLGALKEAPTGALTFESARWYDPDGRGRAMLRQINEEMARQLRPYYQNLAHAERTLEFYQRPGNAGMVEQLREAENSLREAQSERYRAERRIVPMFEELENEVRSALERGRFAVPWDQQVEQLQIDLQNLERQIADHDQLTREVLARMAGEEASDSEPFRIRPDPDPIPDARYLGSNSADFEMSLDEVRQKIIEITQGVENGFSYPGYARNEDGEIVAYGNRPLNELPNIELQYLWDQLRVWHSMRPSMYEPLPDVTPSEADTYVRVLERARLSQTYPPALFGLLDALVPSDRLGTVGPAWYRRLQQLYLEFRSWEATPPEFRTLDEGNKQDMLLMIESGMRSGPRVQTPFRPPGYAEGGDGAPQLWGRPIDELPDNELLLLFVQFRLHDSMYGEEGYRLSVPPLTAERRAAVIEEILSIAARGGYVGSFDQTLPDVLRNYEDYWLQVLHAEVMSREAVPPDVMQRFRAEAPAYTPTHPLPFPAVDVDAATQPMDEED